MTQEMINSQDTSPAEMIRVAVAGGADLEKLKGLLDLQIQWEANEARKAYHKAMTDFKSIPLEIEKDKKVGYSTSKGNVGYSHATLANVVRTITKELSKFGLSASWRTTQDAGKICVTCKVTHVLGHSEETTLCGNADDSGSKNSIKAIGSTVTYLERYTILSALGLATTDQDDDAKSNDVFITEKQLIDLRGLLVNKTITEDMLCTYLEVESLDKTEAKNYMKALQAINASSKKVSK